MTDDIPDTEERKACPACGTIDIRRRVGSDFHSGPVDDKDYRCRECNTSFDDPDTVTINGQPPRVEPARTLWLQGQRDESEQEDSEE